MSVRAGKPESPAVRRVRVTDQQPSVVRAGGPLVMPDLRGLSLREAIRGLGTVGLSARTTGTGFVDAQSPAAGSPIDPGSVGVLMLSRNPALRVGDQR